MTDEQCQEADREFMQYYHRRMCWLALRQFALAVRDADHTLSFMDFVKRHSPNDEYLQVHERYRGFVLFHRTQAAVQLQCWSKKAPERAIHEIHEGIEMLRAFDARFGREDEMEQDGMVRHLRQAQMSLREENQIEPTIEEQLQQAIADEDYELAAVCSSPRAPQARVTL